MPSSHQISTQLLEIKPQVAQKQPQLSGIELSTCNLNYLNLSLVNQDSTTSEKTKIENEQKKFKIIEQIYNSIKPKEQEQKEIEAKKTKNTWWRKALFGFLIVTDITLMTMGGYFGFLELMQLLIPSLSAFAMKLIAIIATGIEGLMMYSVFKPFLQRGLGIQPEAPSDTLVANYSNRIVLMKKINDLMENYEFAKKMGVERYSSYAEVLKEFNKDISEIKLTPYQESKTKKVIRYGLSTLNTGLSIAGTYFGATLLLTAISAALIGTPIGWAIIATIIVAQLLTRFFVRQNSVYDLLNPEAKQQNLVIKQLKNFSNINSRMDQNLKLMKIENAQQPCKRDNKRTPLRRTQSAGYLGLFAPANTVDLDAPKTNSASFRLA